MKDVFAKVVNPIRRSYLTYRYNAVCSEGEKLDDMSVAKIGDILSRLETMGNAIIASGLFDDDVVAKVKYDTRTLRRGYELLKAHESVGALMSKALDTATGDPEQLVAKANDVLSDIESLRKDRGPKGP